MSVKHYLPSRCVASMLFAASRSSGMLLGGAACIAVGTSYVAALADAKPVDPYVVVTTKETEIKCGDGGAFYTVAVAPANKALRVDGEAQGWVRVQYLPGMRAFVDQSEAQLDAGGKTLKLSTSSKLKAASVGQGTNWWPLLEQPLPAGTILNVAEVLKGGDGKTQGYLVEAPAGARGFIRNETVRRATPEEAAAFSQASPAALAPTASPDSTTTASGAGAQPGVTQPGAGSGETSTTTSTPTTPTGASTTDAGAPAVQPATPGAMPAQPMTPSPSAGGMDGSGTSTTTSPTGTTPTTPAPTSPPSPRPQEDLKRLAELFDGVMAPGKTGEEIDAVIAEFNRSISASNDERVKAGLRQRLEALKLKKDILEHRKIVENAPKYTEVEIRVREAVERAQRQSVYTIVGRILPSTVYDGKRGMPLMYRVEAADTASTRTIGYVIPEAGVDLLTKTGKVVGIVGESRFDEALRLNIVAARRVDVLNPSGNFERDPSANDDEGSRRMPLAPMEREDGNGDAAGEGQTPDDESVKIEPAGDDMNK